MTSELEPRRLVSMLRDELVEVARGDAPADLVITSGKLVNVNSGEIYPADVAIKGNRIAAIGAVEYSIGPGTVVIDAEGRYLCPGLIDGHIHLGGSQLSMTEFARAVVPHGTTAKPSVSPSRS
jgi:adenine deaminase